MPQRDIDPADLFLPPTEPIDITWMQAALVGSQTDEREEISRQRRHP